VERRSAKAARYWNILAVTHLPGRESNPNTVQRSQVTSGQRIDNGFSLLPVGSFAVRSPKHAGETRQIRHDVLPVTHLVTPQRLSRPGDNVFEETFKVQARRSQGMSFLPGKNCLAGTRSEEKTPRQLILIKVLKNMIDRLSLALVSRGKSNWHAACRVVGCGR
jgi:hypothetical protein